MTAPGATNPPAGAPAAAAGDVAYAGFWLRVLAALIDTTLFGLLVAPLGMLLGVESRHFMEFDLGAVTGSGSSPSSLTLNLVVPAVAVLAFWITRGATPGKMVIGAVIVDAQTLQPPTQKQLVARYLSYYVSAVVVLLGFVWVAFDARKQGWHDKIAGTVVIRRRRG